MINGNKLGRLKTLVLNQFPLITTVLSVAIVFAIDYTPMSVAKK